MAWHRRESVRIVLLMILALVVRLAFLGVWQRTHAVDPQRFEFPDSASYWELGRHLAAGEPYEAGVSVRRVERAPGYPLLLATMFRVVGQDATPTSARVMGAMLGALTVGAVYWLARQIFGVQAAWLSSAIVALYPEAIAISVLPLSDGPFCLWMMLQFCAWRWATHTQSSSGWGVAAAAGVLGGVATLTRPSWLLFSPLLTVMWTLATRFDGRQLRLSGVMLLSLAATMMPWWIYASRVAGSFVATTLWVGPSLYDGLSPTADGSSEMSFVPRFEAQLRAADAQAAAAADTAPFEARFDRMMRDEAIHWAAQHPAKLLRLAGTKLLRMWNVWPNEAQFRSGLVRLVVCISYTPIVLLAIYGAWHFRQQRPDVLMLLLPAAYFSLLHAIFIGSLRYRQGAMLTLAILAGAALSVMANRWFATEEEPRVSGASI
ncbi:MAG: ArnT family glycosyltransferase [Pirellulales bacterium]